ncbi:glycosyl transferase, partial [Streptomyces botrytidirepellens]
PGPAALADALRRQLAAGPRRYPVPDAVERYDVARGVRRLMDLYDRATTCGPDGCLRGPAAGMRAVRGGERGAPTG